MRPILTWFVDSEPVYNESFIGTYESTDTFEVNMKVINNYLGTEPIDSIKNGKLLVMFKDFEDGSLLNYMQVHFDGSRPLPLEIVGNRGYVKIPRMLSGDYQYPADCTLSIKITFSQALNVRNDLKQLILDIVY